MADKDKQLAQLRERLKEIEWMMSSSQALNENMRLIQRQREREEEFGEEKRALIELHETRVRQLMQETVDARCVGWMYCCSFAGVNFCCHILYAF